MAVLSLDLAVERGAFRLGVDQDIELDGVLGIFGPSGSGKTTLLRAIAGLEPSARGRLVVDGVRWMDSTSGWSLPTHRRQVGYVFQEALLLPTTTVAGNLAYAARRASSPGIGMDEVIAMLRLAPLLDRTTTTLSGGERQRVAIGRALLTQPALMLMDEPLSALDTRARQDTLACLQQLAARFRTPTLYVSHSLDELAALSDRLWVLRDGALVAAGATRDVVARLDLGEVTAPREAGSVLSARVRDHDTVYQLSSLDIGSAVLLVPLLDAVPGTALRVHIHSRDVALATRPPEDISIRNVLPGRVTDIVADPSTPYAEVAVSIGTDTLRARITRAAADALALKAGGEVYALVKSVSVDFPEARDR